MGYAYDGVASGLAAQIRASRSARGWSQRELARQSGISLRSVQRLENPRVGSDPAMEMLGKVANAFDVALVAQFIPVSAMISGLASSCLPERLAPPSFTEEHGHDIPAGRTEEA